jgi:phosphate starvation-inducible PhoH-like protein
MIMDEAQNASYEEIKMFLTRIGNNSRMIISGDTTQRDVPGKRGESFETILDELDTEPYIDGISIFELDETDIVRNGIITKILAKLRN